MGECGNIGLGYYPQRAVMEIIHKTVLLRETIELLDVRPDGIYVDATLGGGGHASEIAKRLKTGLLVGVDQDSAAIERAEAVLAPYSQQVRVVRANFSQTQYTMDTAQISYADGVLMDLGVSSFQFDDGTRGFSYNYDARLDMRMDERQDFSAYDVVNDYSATDLATIFINYGEERWARRIAEFIVDKRTKSPIETTFQLVDIIKTAIPRAARSDGPHPAKRVFQAIRIEVNSELAILEKAIEDFVKILQPGGIICIITFHSLEDRLTKNLFRRLATTCTCPRDFPVCICKTRPSLEIITKRPIIPSDDEITGNNRARSAKLRAARKI